MSGSASMLRRPPRPPIRALVLAALVVAATCTPFVSPAPSPVATRAPDIQRAKLDMVFSGLVSASYFKPSGRDLLVAALDAMRRLARDSSGSDDVATPRFTGTEDSALADFRLFAAAAEDLATKNPRIASRRFGDAGIRAMLQLKPDCHTYYRPGAGTERPDIGAAAAQPDERTDHLPDRTTSRVDGVAAPLGANVRFQLLAGGVGYVAWHAFDTFVFDDVRKALDQLVAQEARSWLLDLRGNVGGAPPQSMASWFVNDGVLWRDLEPDGRTIDVSAQRGFYLPARYQLPIAIVIDHGTGSSPEFLTVALQQRGRARVFGATSAGCLGSFQAVNLPDGSFLAITSNLSIGPVLNTPINGVGIVPDEHVGSSDPVDVAAEYLRRLSS